MLVAAGKFEITGHALYELNNDNLLVQDIISGVPEAIVVETYPDYHKGPSMLVLQHDHDGKPVHALWGTAKGTDTPVYLVTAYRPDPARWSTDFLKRKLK
jgi:Domain of unknown function (DUF4258)